MTEKTTIELKAEIAELRAALADAVGGQELRLRLALQSRERELAIRLCGTQPAYRYPKAKWSERR